LPDKGKNGRGSINLGEQYRVKKKRNLRGRLLSRVKRD